MKALVLYESRSGYTETIGRAIVAALTPAFEVTVGRASEADAAGFADLDLLVVGGPTEAHGATPALHEMLDGLSSHILPGTAAAAFDTRLHWPKLLSGSAAEEAVRALEGAGCRVIAPPESFLVEGRIGVPDELALDHARTWAARLVAAMPVPNRVSR
jgi:flavodoxin